MPELQSSLPEKLRKTRKIATAVFVVLTVFGLFVPMDPDTFHVFLSIPTLLLIFARRFDIAFVIEFAVLGIWLARRLVLEAPPAEGWDDFLSIYIGTIVGILVGFKLADAARGWWQRNVKNETLRSA